MGRDTSDVDLRPDEAPRWLRPLIDQLAASDHSGRVRKMLASRVPQRDRADEAAVLIVFTGDPHAETTPEDAAVLITHRHPKLRSHSGQMAFPGGKIDPEDAGPVDAALREATEETGLERHRVTSLAVFDAVTTGGSLKRVRPVVAYAADPGEVYPASEVETDDVFFVPLRDLVAPENRITVGWRGWTGPAFHVGCYLVWGFTGVLLSVVLEFGGWARPYDEDTVHSLEDTLAQSCNGEQ